MDKTNINDVLKKKVILKKKFYKENREQIKQDATCASDVTNSCFYCHKVFFNSNYLIRHIFRRHSDEIALQYKNYLKPKSNATDTKFLISFLEQEFLALKNELKVIQQAVHAKNIAEDATSKNNIDIDPLENVCNISVNKGEMSNSATEVHSDAFRNLKGKVCDLEANIQFLHTKFEELNTILKTDVLLKQDFKEHLIRYNEELLRDQEARFLELKQDFSKEFQSILSHELCENNSEWKSQISQLNQEIKRLDSVINSIKEEVNSPDYVKTLEEKFEHQIVNFLGCTKQKSRKKSNSMSEARVSNVSECNKFGKRVVPSTNVLESRNRNSFVKNHHHYALTEKLSKFGIAPKDTKLSCSDYLEKLKFVNIEKEHLEKKYQNFSDIYNSINKHADYEVNSKLKKKQRKITFSEPLASTSIQQDSVSVDENFQTQVFSSALGEHLIVTEDQNHPNHKELKTLKKHNFILENADFSFVNGDGSGDCSSNFLNMQNNDPEEVIETTCKIPSLYTNPSLNDDIEYSKKLENYASSQCNETYCVSFEMQKKK